MGVDTKIEWCDATYSPWWGCTKVSAGCTNCYAETLSNRYKRAEWGPNGVRVIASEKAWGEPLKWDRAAKAAGERRRVFCASMGDVFEDRPELAQHRDRLFGLIAHTVNLDWLVLTKRPAIAQKYLEEAPRFDNIPDEVSNLRLRLTGEWNETELVWPLPNLWLGVSVENQQTADERIPILLQMPAAVRFLSCEPLLSPIEFSDVTGRVDAVEQLGRRALAGISWCIVGGESGTSARPFNLAWARSLRDQCRTAGVAFFMKQMGSHPIGEDSDAQHSQQPTKYALGTLLLRDRKGGDISEFPEDLRVREFPQGAP